MQTKILYEDDAMFVIYKPAGLAVQSARIGQMDAESELRNYVVLQARKKGQSISGKPYIGIVHRLDQPVEGVLVVAKTKEAAASLTKQLTDGTLQKTYLAVAQIQQPSKEETFVDFMIKDGSFANIVSAHTAGAKKAILHYHMQQQNVLEDGTEIGMAAIEIQTGRFHQIRCQMAHHHMPLLGDAKYGGSQTDALSKQLGIRTVALCANRITGKHPTTGKVFCMEVQPQNPAFAKFL